MIAERYITEWSDNFPWTKNSFVEQDMVTLIHSCGAG